MLLDSELTIIVWTLPQIGHITETDDVIKIFLFEDEYLEVLPKLPIVSTKKDYMKIIYQVPKRAWHHNVWW